MALSPDCWERYNVLLLVCTRKRQQNTGHPDPKVANNCLNGACPTLGKSIGVTAGDKENMATSLSASQHLLGGRKGTMQVTALAPGLHFGQVGEVAQEAGHRVVCSLRIKMVN